MHRRFDNAHRVGLLQLILAEGHRCRRAVSPELTWPWVSEGGLGNSRAEMPLNGGADQPAKLFFVHSTHSS
jgi:hypothetical protein